MRRVLNALRGHRKAFLTGAERDLLVGVPVASGAVWVLGAYLNFW